MLWLNVPIAGLKPNFLRTVRRFVSNVILQGRFGSEKILEERSSRRRKRGVRQRTAVVAVLLGFGRLVHLSLRLVDGFHGLNNFPSDNFSLFTGRLFRRDL